MMNVEMVWVSLFLVGAFGIRRYARSLSQWKNIGSLAIRQPNGAYIEDREYCRQQTLNQRIMLAVSWLVCAFGGMSTVDTAFTVLCGY